jgi:hypothetical protein
MAKKRSQSPVQIDEHEHGIVVVHMDDGTFEVNVPELVCTTQVEAAALAIAIAKLLTDLNCDGGGPQATTVHASPAG